MELASVRLPLRVLADADGWQLSKWLVNQGGPVYRKQRVAVLKSTETGAIDHALAPHSGTLFKSLVAEGAILDSSNAPIAEIQFCPHSVVFKGVCAVCGEEAAPAHFAETPSVNEDRLPVAYNSSSLSVTRAEAESVSSLTARRLFESKRLSLVLDLDHTLVHATDDPRAGAILHHSPENVDRSSVSSFTLGPTLESRMTSLMFVKLRPHLAEFLARVAAKFELHIYTMGSRPYADQVANLIDPDKRLFSGRITSREDFAEGRFNQKSIERLFPCDDSMVLIVDDREDVWISTTGQPYMPNLVRADPYSFWDGLHEAYNRASATSEPEDPASIQNPPLSQWPAPVVLHVNGNGEPLEASRVLHAGERSQDASNLPRDPMEKTEKTGAQGFGENSEKDENSKPHASLRQEIGKTNSWASAGSTREHEDTTKVSETKIDRNADLVANLTDCSAMKDAPNSNELKQNGNVPEAESKGNGREAEAPDVLLSKEISGISEEGSALGQSGSVASKEEPAPVFSAELRRIVSGWWAADAEPRSSEHLLRLADVLEECHSEFFGSSGAKRASEMAGSSTRGPFQAPADVKRILARLRRKVLSDCVITFTGVIPTGADPTTVPAWNLAKRLGARCSMDFVNGYTTHVVASQHRAATTQKCKEALESEGTFVVTTQWLDDSAMNFERQMELPYRVRLDDRFKTAEEHRRWVTEKHAGAAHLLKKRDWNLLKDSTMEGMYDSKRKRLEEVSNHGSNRGDSQSPNRDSVIHVLSGDELDAAMDALFED